MSVCFFIILTFTEKENPTEMADPGSPGKMADRKKLSLSLLHNSIKKFHLKIQVQVVGIATVYHTSLGRIAHTTYVDAAYCYRPSSVVCLSVGLSVCHISN